MGPGFSLNQPTGPRPQFHGAPVHGAVHRRRSGRALAIGTLVVVVLIAAGAAAYVERHHIRKFFAGGPSTSTTRVTTTTLPKVVPPPAVASSLATWQLPVPVAGALVLPGPAGELLVVGGEVTSGSSGNGAFLVGTQTGKLTLAANLVAGVHDVAGASVAGKEYVFGGSSGGPSSTVQSFPVPAPTGVKSAPTAVASGALPTARAGATAVDIGPTAYIVGGYDGTAADPWVLSTSDGSSFVTVAKLPVPVRDAAVTATGGQIYVFGGAALVAGHWAPVADIQHVDPANGHATVVGHLPVPLEGAVAVNIDGAVYVAGGHGPAGFNGVVWGFEPPAGQVVTSGHLPHGVSGAGATVEAGVAWLVGGDSASGKPVGWVQTLHLTRAVQPAPAKKQAKSPSPPAHRK